MSTPQQASRALVSRLPSVSLRRHMGTVLLLAAAACLASGVARAQDNGELVVGLQDQAVTGHVADVGSTAVGLAMGAAEANPLGLLTLGVKAVAYQQIKEAPAVEQPEMWSTYGAFGWGATANNLCVIAAIASGGAGAALCPLIGMATGVGVYSADEENRNRATFEAMCAQQREMNPQINCIYTPIAQR